MKYCYLFALVFFVSCTASRQSRIAQPVRLQIDTDSGTMVVRLYDQTPLHRDNFLKLAKEGFYDQLLFHRVIKNFMIQGGDPDSKDAAAGARLGEGGLAYTIPAEFDSTLFHKKGALAMAREGDRVNPEKASSSTQFYIVQGKVLTDDELNSIEKRFNIVIPANQKEVYKTVGGTPFLDRNYTVFGEVESGLDVIDKIAAVPTDNHDRPTGDIQMKVSILKASKRR